MTTTQPTPVPATPAASSASATVLGRDANPAPRPSATPRGSLTPSDAATSLAPTVPPEAGHGAGAAPPPPEAPPDPEPLPRLSTATVATPSTVMAAAVASQTLSLIPTTLPGVTTDQLTPPPAEARVTAKRPSQPQPAASPVEPPRGPGPGPGAETRLSKPAPSLASQPLLTGRRDPSIEHYPPPEDSGDVIAGRPRPEPAAVDTGTDTAVVATRPKRGKQPAVIIDDPAPPGSPPPPDADSASTQPRLPAVRPSQLLPLPAPPASDPAIKMPREDKRAHRPSSQWAAGLASRVDRAFEDEVANSTPVHGPSQSELASLLGRPEATRLTPMDQIQQLVRESVTEDTADDAPLFEGWDRGATPPGARTEPQAAVGPDGRPLDHQPHDTPVQPDASERTRRPRSTQEVEPEAIEASIQEVPRVATRPGEPAAGPPPATRPSSTSSRLKRIKPTE
jgi:hypothetical protein